MAVNCHTIDGQNNRKIPADRDKFTTAACQGSAQAAMTYRNRLAATQAAKIRHFVGMGDFNMTKNKATTALRFMPPGVDTFQFNGDTKNDFVISNVPQTPLLPGPEAHDGRHRAFRACLELPPVDEPQAPAESSAAPGATRGTAASGDVAMGDVARARADRGAAEVLRSFYQTAAEHKQLEQEQQEQQEQEEQRGGGEEEEEEQNNSLHFSICACHPGRVPMLSTA